MVYRMLSVCGALGYGYDEESLNEATKLKLDLIASDAGSMDAGPYYLGKGAGYFSHAALKRDFSLMLKAALQQDCPLILGSCGMSGDDPHLETMLGIAKEVFEEQQVKNVKVAVVSSHVNPSLLIGEINKLQPLGKMQPLTEEDINKSAIVGQMGIAPFISALKAGAQVIFCGRACDVAIFAAPAIYNGVDPGLAFHAGHILECGALACDPGSASDVLIAEIEQDKVTFIAPNKARKVTPRSIAAHSLYEESHPSLQFYPEGALVMEHTEYVPTSETTAAIKNSLFVHNELTLKLEGSRKIGERYISLLFCQKESDIPKEYILYGCNGVQTTPIKGDEQEIGILITATSRNKTAADALTSLIKGYMLHYGYPNRRTTAGNISFPISPSAINFEKNNLHTSLVVAGTREVLFIERYDEIISAVTALAKENFKQIYEECKLTIYRADADHPLLFLDSVAKTKEMAEKLHQETLNQVAPWIDKTKPQFENIFGGEVYVWSLYHLLKNRSIIDQLFPIKLYTANGKDWQLDQEIHPKPVCIGISKTDYAGSIDPTKVDAIKATSQSGKPIGYKSMLEMATVIRTKDAGVNTLTYDIFFKTDEDYQLALESNIFEKENLAKLLDIPRELIIGTYHVDTCNAIKISRYREKVSGTPGSRDVFGAQQQLKIEELQIPIFK